MMSMDALTAAGFTLANFCDTSGNPSAAKVYAAARIILSQPDIIGYFGSGSGVASQEQYWSAYGLAKAFLETSLSIPAVIRLGGNGEDRAVDILHRAAEHLPAPVVGLKKDDTPAACAEIFASCLNTSHSAPLGSLPRRVPPFVGRADARAFELQFGTLWIDPTPCNPKVQDFLQNHCCGLFHVSAGAIEPTCAPNDLRTKDSELIALEIELFLTGNPVLFVDLPIPGLDATPEYQSSRPATQKA